MLCIDPPFGWRYGFPRPFINTEGIPTDQWLIAHGYPKEEIIYKVAEDGEVFIQGIRFFPCREDAEPDMGGAACD